ncbi:MULTISPECIES: ATP-binding protein [unclassified Streptomyces]|uniref:ATP-binding protein n=1 Tax=unclassified Streptomyces TaxID=2593676 RepID=UPI0033275B8D
MDASTYIETARSPAAATPVPPQSAAPARADSRPCVWKLPHHPAAAGTARRITSAVLDGWDVAEETIDQALLVVSELVTNAVEHARPPVALHLQRPGNDGVLRIEVGDGGPADHEGAWTTSCAPEERGRGVGIIALLACAHGARVLAHTVTHWAVLPAAASRGSPG